jgi:hypothetical protein
VDFTIRIENKIFYYARARARVYSKAIALALVLSAPAALSFAVEPPFILGQDAQIHGIALDHSKEQATRGQMGISDDCSWIKKQASAIALVGSDGASVDPRVKSTRGVFVLEGLKANAAPKVLHTHFLSPYENYSMAIPGEIGIQPGPRYRLALTIAATLAGSGDLVFQKGDYVIVHADGQLFAYPLPEMTIPSEGLVRVYLGTDDQLYYDAALTHPVHAGACGSKS